MANTEERKRSRSTTTALAVVEVLAAVTVLAAEERPPHAPRDAVVVGRGVDVGLGRASFRQWTPSMGQNGQPVKRMGVLYLARELFLYLARELSRSRKWVSSICRGFLPTMGQNGSPSRKCDEQVDESVPF